MEEWLVYSIIVCIITSFIAISLKYLGNYFNNVNEIRLFMCISLIITGIISFIYLIYFVSNKNKFFKNIVNKKIKIIILLFISLLIFLNFLFQCNARVLCKVPGYPQLVINLNIILILLLSIIFFNKELNLRICLGIIITIIGLSIILLNNK